MLSINARARWIGPGLGPSLKEFNQPKPDPSPKMLDRKSSNYHSFLVGSIVQSYLLICFRI
jgi:hypothetical protein